MSDRPRTYWLSLHLPYACRHSGVCCSSGWDIPIETTRVSTASRLRGDLRWLRPAAGAAPGLAGILAREPDGRCVFRRERCDLHRAYGHRAIPLACQHFPRVAVISPSGVSVSLSHYCPTAADLLFSHEGPVDIVEGPPPIPEGGVEGLDASNVLPPLLSDAVLMDWEGFRAWERHIVRVLTTGDGPPEQALDLLDADWRRVQQWRPGGSPLTAAIAACTRGVRESSQGVAAGADAVLRRYLAARAFASWQPYGTAGAGAVLAHLRRALAIVRALPDGMTLKERIRHADLVLLHASEPHDRA